MGGFGFRTLLVVVYISAIFEELVAGRSNFCKNILYGKLFNSFIDGLCSKHNTIEHV